MNEFLGGIDDLGSVRSDISQITEEDVQRVQENSKRAKQIAQQIKKDKAINAQLAKFLGFLMGEIKNDELIIAIHRSFFKTTNPQDQVTYLRKDINTPVLVGFFAPFFLTQISEFKIWIFYDKLWVGQAANSINNYIDYLKKLSSTYHDNIPIDQGPLIELIVLIVQEFLQGVESKELWNQVMLALYGEK